MNSLAHVEINVSDLEKSVSFYERVLIPLAWEKVVIDPNQIIGFKAPDKTHIWLVQTEPKYLENQYHRKNIGVNHLALRLDSKEAVNTVTEELAKNGVKTLYTRGPKDYSNEYHMDEYYAVFFEDPDRIKLEIVYLK